MFSETKGLQALKKHKCGLDKKNLCGKLKVENKNNGYAEINL